jgi:AraC-like DNA-binding protein
MTYAAAMSGLPEEISEKHVIGKRGREWLVGPGEAPALEARRIDWAGLSDVTQPYAIARRAPAFGHVVGCVGGVGEVWLGGAWRRVGAGMVFLNPPGWPQALRAAPGRRWRICWVHTRADFFAAGSGAVIEPELAEADPRPLWNALDGLRLCLQANPGDVLAEAWGELVFAHAHRLATGAGGPQRLARLWEEVARAPGEPWDVERLCARAGMSREHLRRVALKEAGRTPMEQVAYLRMRRAAGLLRMTHETLEAVAEAVGYGNAFVFSNAFKRVMGLRPGVYRAGGAGGAAAKVAS